MKENEHIYRSSFWTFFFHIYTIFVIIVFIDDNFDIDVEAFCFATVVMLLLNFVAIRYFKITITDEGIRGYNIWGKYAFVKWDEIESVKIRKIVFLKYFRLFYKSSKRPLWIPLFLKKYEELSRVVTEKTPENNPFRNVLEKK